MAKLVLAALILSSSYPAQPSELPITGLATYYNPGIMERAAYLQSRNHGFELDSDVVGYVAMLEVKDMGRIVCITANGRTVGPLQVADVAGRDVRERLRERGWVVDIDWDEWQALGLPKRPMLVTVAECKPARKYTPL